MASLTNNTTQLQNLLAKVNTLPEAGGSSNVETYTLKIESDGAAFVDWIEYAVFEENEYQYYCQTGFKSIEQYPIYIENVALNSPISIGLSGFTPALYPVSNFIYKHMKNLTLNYTELINESGKFLPIKADENNQIVVKCISDD